MNSTWHHARIHPRWSKRTEWVVTTEEFVGTISTKCYGYMLTRFSAKEIRWNDRRITHGLVQLTKNGWQKLESCIKIENLTRVVGTKALGNEC